MSTVECGNSQPDADNGHEANRAVTRYGKEELLAFYRQGEYTLPEELIEWDDIVSLVELKPYSLTPATEYEQRNLNQAMSGNPKLGSSQFKTTSQRQFTRTITNSSKLFSRPNPMHHGFGTDNFSSADTHDHPSDNSSQFGDSLPFRSSQQRSSHLSFSSSSNACSRSVGGPSNPFKRGSGAGSIVAGSWRNSNNTRYVQPKQGPQYPSTSTEDSEIPEWLEENVTDMNPTEMTFDNQGKFVPVSSLKKAEPLLPSVSRPAVADVAILRPPEPKAALPTPVAPPVCEPLTAPSENDPSASFDFESLRRHIDRLASQRNVTEQISKDSSQTSMQTTLGESVQWMYIDPQDIIRGPFPDKQMDKWYSAGYFKPSILIRRSTDTKFSHLGEYVAALGSSFLYSRQPIRGLSEYITPSVKSDETPKSWSVLAEWLVKTLRMMVHSSDFRDLIDEYSNVDTTVADRSVPATLAEQPMGKPAKTSAKNVPSITAHHNISDQMAGMPQSPSTGISDEITRRLGFNDPCIMAVSNVPVASTQGVDMSDNYFQQWQKVPEKGFHKKLKPKEQTSMQSNPQTILMQGTILPSLNEDTTDDTPSTRESQINPLFRSNEPCRSTLYDYVIGSDVNFTTAGSRHDKDERLAPWAIRPSDDIALLSSNLDDIMREEEDMREKQLQIERMMTSQESIRGNLVSTNSSQGGAPMGWRMPNYSPVESFNKIQLEEIRKSQNASSSMGNPVDGDNFKPENLNRLRQLQKPQERDNYLGNWAHWKIPAERIWKQEMSNACERADLQRQTIAKDPACTRGNITLDEDIVRWAREELVSMYGSKVRADTVVNLLCKFNTPAEMESFIRQSLGTHSKVAHFAAAFNRRLTGRKYDATADDDYKAADSPIVSSSNSSVRPSQVEGFDNTQPLSALGIPISEPRKRNRRRTHK